MREQRPSRHQCPDPKISFGCKNKLVSGAAGDLPSAAAANSCGKKPFTNLFTHGKTVGSRRGWHPQTVMSAKMNKARFDRPEGAFRHRFGSRKNPGAPASGLAYFSSCRAGGWHPETQIIFLGNISPARAS